MFRHGKRGRIPFQESAELILRFDLDQIFVFLKVFPAYGVLL